MPEKSWTPSEDELKIAEFSTRLTFETHGFDLDDPKVEKLIKTLVDVSAHHIAGIRFYASAFHRETFKNATNPNQVDAGDRG